MTGEGEFTKLEKQKDTKLKILHSILDGLHPLPTTATSSNPW